MLTGRRWWIVWLLFLSTTINYINRQTLSVLAPVVSEEFHLNHTQLSQIFGAFQISYAGTWLLGGLFLDAVGTRLGLSLAVLWWSVVSAATGLANSAAALGALRFLLGIGEGLNWPGASKTVAEFFPARERSVAVAIFDSGSSVGGGGCRLDDSVDRIAVRMAVGVRILGFAGLRLAGGVACGVSRRGARRCEDAAAQMGGMACYGAAAGDMGHRTGKVADGSDLVVLRFLASAVFERCARI